MLTRSRYEVIISLPVHEQARNIRETIIELMIKELMIVESFSY